MDKSAIKEFWDRKARNYPNPFEKKTLEWTQSVLKRVRDQGVTFFGKSVLDIGCGKGAYTLPISYEASYVLGLDCSSSMLETLTMEAERRGMKNVDVLHGFWEDLEPERMNLFKRFDIVMAMMAPCVRNERDILKMEACSKEWLIYLGWEKRKNELMEKVLAMHGIEWNCRSLAFSLCVILERLRRKPHFEFFDRTLTVRMCMEEALHELCNYIELYGKKPKKDLVEKELKKHIKSGYVEQKTDAEVALILWKVPKEEGL
ncbi:MAG: class I SAM-dependent methyltransferase [Desulfobacterota bacterium]|nr:class I SAM-dependent methyltransferase [Thermodesulfobacteriota bacterium]MDW8001456.1 class I SAM-dependent methyltransferase [Deltaproteobacteria bacterium]